MGANLACPRSNSKYSVPSPKVGSSRAPGLHRTASGKDAEAGETHRGGPGAHAEMPHGLTLGTCDAGTEVIPRPQVMRPRSWRPCRKKRGPAPEPRAPGSRVPHPNREQLQPLSTPGRVSALPGRNPTAVPDPAEADRGGSTGRAGSSHVDRFRAPGRKGGGPVEGRPGAGTVRPAQPRPGGQTLTGRRRLRQSCYLSPTAPGAGRHQSRRKSGAAAGAAQKPARGPAHSRRAATPSAVASIGRSGRGHAHGSRRLAGRGGTRALSSPLPADKGGSLGNSVTPPTASGLDFAVKEKLWGTHREPRNWRLLRGLVSYGHVNLRSQRKETRTSFFF